MLIGREDLLRSIVRSMSDAIPVLLEGEQGVGKTTLLRVAAATTGMIVLEGGALGMLSHLPYLALERATAARFPSDADTAWVAEEVERRAKDAVLVIDDLHWAHHDTVTVLSLLAGRVSAATAVRRGDPNAASAREALPRFEHIAVEPLGPSDADALLDRLRPGLAHAQRRRLFERTGGNPLLIEELSAMDEPSDSLRVAVEARMRVLSRHGRDAMAMLALAGRPLPASSLGEGLEEVAAAGLALESRDGWTFRHGLLAEIFAEAMDGEWRAATHERLALLVSDATSRARHLSAAGRAADAYEVAIEAARSAASLPERAANLALAASCSPHDDRDALRVEAASALVAVREYAEAEDVLDAVRSDDPTILAHAYLLRCDTRAHAGDRVGMRAAVEEGLRLVPPGSDPGLEARLRAEHAQQLALYDWDLQSARAEAATAMELARASGRPTHEAEHAAAVVLYLTDDPAMYDVLERVMDGARAAGDRLIEFWAGQVLCEALEHRGDLTAAYALALRLAARAREMHLTHTERRVRVTMLWMHLFAGRFADVLADALELLAEPLDSRARVDCEIWLSGALVAMGRLDEARAIVDRAAESARPIWLDEGRVLLERASVDLWSGRPEDALRGAKAILDDASYARYLGGYALTISAWACFDLGRRPDPVPDGASDWRAWTVRRHEVAALHALADDPRAASAAFDEAVGDFATRVVDRVRCTYGAAEALRLAGDPGAVERLGAVEQQATAYGMQPMLGRVRRSLRLCGIRRSAARRKTGQGLTAREREVLVLVADGATNAEIARRLGISRPTVVRIVSTASAKLGATSRIHAVALLE